MSYMFVLGACISCGMPFSFNPRYVPSVRVQGTREPVCKGCVERENARRIETGSDMPQLEIHPNAYDPEEVV